MEVLLPSKFRQVTAICLFVMGMLATASCSVVLDTDECTTDDDCHTDSICSDDALCQPIVDMSCTASEDCPPGYHCPDAGQCRYIAELECDNHLDCPPGYQCSSQRQLCEVGILDCDADDDCPPNYQCSEHNDCELGELECGDDTDCPDGYTCGDDELCLDTSAQCEHDDDCLEVVGEGAICTDDGFCEGDTGLTGGPCQQLYGPVDEEDVFLIGVVMQLSGVGGGFGRPMLDAIRIAKRDFNAHGGISHIVGDDEDPDADPIDEIRRPIGIVACDTEAQDELAAQGAEHLIDEAGVDVILGFNSSQVIDIVPDITSPRDVLVMSPSATATTLPSDDLFWRTAPSDDAQGVGLTRLVKYVLTDYLPAEGIDEPYTARLVRRDDQWSVGLGDVLDGDLPGDITSRFYPYTFPNVGAGDHPDYAPVAADIATEDPQPELAVVLGSADSWQLIEYIDAALDGDPLFIGADAMKNAEEASRASSELESRIWGTGPQAAAEADHAPYTIFRLRFEEEMNDNADNYQFVANAFDALYTIAFAASANGFTGPDIAAGLQKLDSGTEIQPRSDDIAQAFDILGSGSTIDYVGASGPINFDDDGNPQSMPIALWCFEEGQIPERGIIYEPDTEQFTPLTCDPQ